MARDVKHPEACVSCARNRLTQREKITKQRLLPAAEPFAIFIMDILGPLPETTRGNLYFLLICDWFYRRTSAKSLKTMTAMDVTSASCV